MSHYHCEIIMPPTDDVDAAVKEILEPFNENNEDAVNGFWDWWVIGGRWAGAKTEARLDPEKLEAFNQWMVSEKVMVSAFRAGKEELADAVTREKVDAKWREMFPGAGEHCTLFSHSNNQYGERLPGDVCPLIEVDDRVTAARVIIAGPKYDGSGLEANYMVEQSYWNGVDHVKTWWDGRFMTALSDFRTKLKRYAEGYRAKAEPQPDWLVVTVDYHS